MEFTNHKITEVLCAFHFDVKEENEWNLGKFPDFFKQIEQYGFSQSQQMQAKHFQIDLNPDVPKYSQVEGDLKFLYTTKDNKQGIIMGRGYISFHNIGYYSGWENFLPDAERFLNAYTNIGLGKKMTLVQMMFINKFDIDSKEYISDYVTFVPEIRNFKQGSELSHSFQSTFEVGKDAQLTLTTVCTTELYHKNIELTLDCISKIYENKEWQSILSKTHDANVQLFKNIATNHFQKTIK